ncbi:hypothetical protein M0805_005941 [Coniferiporia weirii]|nr:hypothetical protein M0805_005941 [Coniferiporia weirii]
MPKVKLVVHFSKATARLARLKSRLCLVHKPRRDAPPKEPLSTSVTVVQSDHHKLLGQMPADVILHVFMHLDVADVLSLSQVSHLFYDVSQSLSVWANLAFKLMCRGRRVSLHDFLSTSSLSIDQLKHSVLITTAAEASWKKDKPECVTEPRIVRLDNVDLDHASYVMKFTSRRHLVLPTKAGELIGWDTRSSSPAGNYIMGAESVLINVQGDYSTRSLYWITGRMSTDLGNENNLHLKILRIQFPEPSSSCPVIFEELGDLRTSWSLAAELHFLDASQNMICAIFECSESNTTGLHVVLDWKTGLSYICDTGIPYEYGRAVIGLHLSDDKKSIILRSEDGGTEIRRAYSLAFMRSRATPWNPSRSLVRGLPVLQPAAESSFPWEHDRAIFTNQMMTPHTVWVLPQWWPTYPGVPRRISTIILFLAIDETAAGLRRVWRAAQHYSDVVERGAEGGAEDNADWKGKNREEELGGVPCAPVRSVIEITDPVLISLGTGLPILAQSFNHLGWIEEREENTCKGGRFGFKRLRSSRWMPLRKAPRRRRTLKLVTFPDPGVSPRSQDCTADEIDGVDCKCTTLRPVTLDVPESVLEQVYHMFLDPAAGTITLATEDNELHVYQYGKPPLP